MKNNLFLFILLIISNSLFAQNKEIIHLWQGLVPTEKSAKKPDLEVKESSLLKVTGVTDPILEVFKANVKEAKATPAVIIFPGGGYSILALDLEGNEIAKWFNSIGYTAFVLHYRVPDNRIGALQDAQRAIKLVTSMAAKYHINSNQIGILGFSAGGSLAARLSTRYNETLYKVQDKADSNSAKPAFTALIYPAYLDEGPLHSLSSELKLDSAITPAMFLFQTSDDPYGNSSLVMASALRNHKIPVELHLLPYGGHGYGLRPGNDAALVWPHLLALWLKKIYPD